MSSSEGSSGSSDGVKSIADILNSADRQLKLSREFADKMAVRRSVYSYGRALMYCSTVIGSFPQVCPPIVILLCGRA